ncbi:MAG TPA: NAD(P)/FAD-dependent oxidoreductase [Acidimicrobiales bacterium]|nr:NAD(P)/FAD-dependent oxidoreductase [Acidimicrobiales bacterium]
MTDPIVVVGAGHNGLVAACYLAQAGRDVVVVEQLDRPGGGARTEETVPGYRFDLHSAAHNIINMTDIPSELDLAGAGLVYQEMDPFSIAIHADGRRVRFFRSIEATVDSIAEHSPAEAQAYRRFMSKALPVVRTVLPAIRGDMSPRVLPGQVGQVVRSLRRQPLSTLRDVLSPYDPLLRRWLPSDLTRGPVAAFAAHAGVGPSVPGGALFAFWQAAYHLFGQWHGQGGAQNLTDALVARLRSLGGEVRCSAAVERIEAPAGRVRAVVLEGGERFAAAAVVTAMDPRTALLRLLDPPLAGEAGADLAAARRSNVVQAVVHVATDSLPQYAGSRPGDWNGLQSYVDHLDDLTSAWAQAEVGRLPDPLPLYAFTPSALDDRLAPAGHHTVYIACPAAPSTIEGGWPSRRDELVERCLSVLESRAPGFGRSVQGIATWTPDEMERVGRWPGGHPMYLDIALDQLGPFRPTKRLGRWRTPIEGLYISGAGTNPTGGIAGTPGRQAARVLLADEGRRRRR